MKLLVGVCLLVSLVSARERLPCPVPHYHETTDEVVCDTYSACEWVGSDCLLRHQEEIGYVISGEKADSAGKSTYRLERKSEWSLFNTDIKNLVFEIFRYDDNHVRVKITDADSSRYEVPVPLNLEEPSKEPENPQYEVVLSDESSGSLFDFKVVRKSTGTVIFDTSSVSGFVYEDQFLQISTALPSSYVYGMGENTHEHFKHTFDNTTYNVFSRDQPTVGGTVNEYGTHPVYHCIEDNEGNSHATFFFSSNAQEYSLRDLPDTSPGIIFRTIGGIFDIHFFLGPNPEDLIQQYTKAVGFPMMPPYWGLGFQLSRYGYDNIENMQKAVNRTRDAKIPHDVQFLDIDYFDKRRDFTYDKDNFAGLPEYLRYLKTVGIRFIPILDPALVIEHETYEPYQRGSEKNVFVNWPTKEDVPEDQPEQAKDFVVGYVWPESKTVFPDFLWEPTHDWWVNENKIYHETIPFDGLWIDMNEPANFGTNEEKPFNWPEDLPPWSLKCGGNQYDDPPYPTQLVSMNENPSKTFSDNTICMISQHEIVDGETTKKYKHYDVHTLYGWSESVASYRANHESTGQRPLVISRSTFPSSGKYVGHWLGDNFADWNNMRRSIIGMFEFNMFGIPYNGADICGFINPTTEELCSRWMSLGSFYPFSRNHNDLNSPEQDPALWESTAEASRKALGARYTMLPYLYTLMYSAHTEGHSVVRPLMNQFPADLKAREIDDVLMWGPHVLIAPIIEEDATSRKVYFPEGQWYSYWDKKMVQDGAGDYNLDADITSIGVFLRGGAIIPTKKVEMNTDLNRKNPFELLIALDKDGKASGEVFWDDGVTEGAIEDKKYYYSKLTFEKNTLTMKVSQSVDLGDELKLSHVQVLGLPEQPSSVTVEGQKVEFTYDGDVKTLDVHLQRHMKDDLTMEIK